MFWTENMVSVPDKKIIVCDWSLASSSISGNADWLCCKFLRKKCPDSVNNIYIFFYCGSSLVSDAKILVFAHIFCTLFDSFSAQGFILYTSSTVYSSHVIAETVTRSRAGRGPRGDGNSEFLINWLSSSPSLCCFRQGKVSSYVVL